MEEAKGKRIGNHPKSFLTFSTKCGLSKTQQKVEMERKRKTKGGGGWLTRQYRKWESSGQERRVAWQLLV